MNNILHFSASKRTFRWQRSVSILFRRTLFLVSVAISLTSFILFHYVTTGLSVLPVHHPSTITGQSSRPLVDYESSNDSVSEFIQSATPIPLRKVESLSTPLTSAIPFPRYSSSLNYSLPLESQRMQIDMQFENATETENIVINNSSKHIEATESSQSYEPLVTNRTTCRELDSNAQTCLFEGLSCIETMSSTVFIVDDKKNNYEDLKSDKWCSFRHQSADPKYFSSRHWPFFTDTVVPQRSCMKAKYINSQTLQQLLRRKSNLALQLHVGQVKWVSKLSLINLDYADNPHNNHLLKDIVWLLDASLFQQSVHGVLQNTQSSQLYSSTENQNELSPLHKYIHRKNEHSTFYPYDQIFLPQTREEFETQTSVDMNRLMYGIILQKPLTNLYVHSSSSSKQTANTSNASRPLFDAYPELKDQLIFKSTVNKDIDEVSSKTSLICTPKLLVGAKIADTGHERVCRHIRTKSYQAFGIKRPEVVRLGQIRYPRPPRSVLILDRHVTRRIENIETLRKELSAKLAFHEIELQYTSTEKLKTAEDYVRVFSSAGVILSPHGSQNMGLLWMQRHR